jgi:hypothetical protein
MCGAMSGAAIYLVCRNATVAAVLAPTLFMERT